MAKFRFKYAVMGAGKSQELSRVHYNYTNKKQKVLVLVPTTDNRNGVGIVAARSGERISATAITPGTMRDWLETNFSKEYSCVLVDETQFFKRDDIFALKEKVVIENNVPVISYGLKNDFMNNLFEGTQACLIVAEESSDIMTTCSYCNKKAIMNLRFEDGTPVKEGDQIMIGDEEYKPVCHYHYIHIKDVNEEVLSANEKND